MVFQAEYSYFDLPFLKIGLCHPKNLLLKCRSSQKKALEDFKFHFNQIIRIFQMKSCLSKQSVWVVCFTSTQKNLNAEKFCREFVVVLFNLAPLSSCCSLHYIHLLKTNRFSLFYLAYLCDFLTWKIYWNQP